MKHLYGAAAALWAALAMSISLTSCIKDEALNAECDITELDPAWLEANKDILAGSRVVENAKVTVMLRPGIDRTALAPKFLLTPGASLTITDAAGKQTEGNGAVRNFDQPQTYTTHSEDGAWHKEYTVYFPYAQPIEQCSFEDVQLNEKEGYYEWMQPVPEADGTKLYKHWATGNGGFALTGMGKTPDDYPTSVLQDGIEGRGVKLVTRETGSFGEQFKMPIAAGNLFIGEFRAGQAALFPMKATRFGLQLVASEPLRLEGFYKYRAGETFTDKQKNPVPERRDSCDIYAVVYECDTTAGAKFQPLQGDNVLTSERIVSLARLDNQAEGDKWRFFSEPFVMRPGKSFKADVMKKNGYAIAIVATSSRQGAYFEGAVGSVLCIDELKVVWRKD